MGLSEDEQATRDAITEDVESDDLVSFDIKRVAAMEWDEDPAPDRPEMTGQWRVTHRDGSSDPIDLPQANVAGAVEEAKDLIARKLTSG